MFGKGYNAGEREVGKGAVRSDVVLGRKVSSQWCLVLFTFWEKGVKPFPCTLEAFKQESSITNWFGRLG